MFAPVLRARIVSPAGALSSAAAPVLTSGIDMALRVVERYFGREAAARTAFYMEYESDGWQG
ncbi:MAG: hypothetical protein V3T72_00090 [Thermoanaerobaculia bacterium]